VPGQVGHAHDESLTGRFGLDRGGALDHRLGTQHRLGHAVPLARGQRAEVQRALVVLIHDRLRHPVAASRQVVPRLVIANRRVVLVATLAGSSRHMAGLAGEISGRAVDVVGVVPRIERCVVGDVEGTSADA